MGDELLHLVILGVFWPYFLSRSAKIIKKTKLVSLSSNIIIYTSYYKHTNTRGLSNNKIVINIQTMLKELQNGAPKQPKLCFESKRDYNTLIDFLAPSIYCFFLSSLNYVRMENLG